MATNSNSVVGENELWTSGEQDLGTTTDPYQWVDHDTNPDDNIYQFLVNEHYECISRAHRCCCFFKGVLQIQIWLLIHLQVSFQTQKKNAEKKQHTIAIQVIKNINEHIKWIWVFVRYTSVQ